MKIGYTGLDLPEQKVKYRDPYLIALSEKDRPKKISPFFVKFIRDEFIQTETVVVPKDHLLDLLILDMDKIDVRLTRTTDFRETALLKKCMDLLEAETVLCDVSFDEEEKKTLLQLGPVTLKPITVINGNEEVNAVIERVLEKAGYMFFYTSASSETHAWLVKKNTDIVTCAAKIHTDLARGFIKADVVGFDDYMRCHNMNECKSKGLAKLTDRDYIVQPREIIEIRFNV